MSPILPPRDRLTIGFAHVAYRMKEAFDARGTGVRHFQVYDRGELDRRCPEIDVLVVSGLWHNGVLNAAPKLRWIQSIGAGYDQFPLDDLRKRGIRLTRAYGVNRNAVAEHTFALILSLSRHLHYCRDNQRKHLYRQMISDIARREDELGGKTLGIIGLGHIGSRVAELGKAFDMRVIATKRDPGTYRGHADRVLTPDHADEVIGQADFLVLNCPLTPQTRGLINTRTLGLMKPSAFLVNVARGGCVDEPALLAALREGRIAGAALDHFNEDPLPPSSPFWDLDNALITPHTAGETRKYEENVIDILLENLARLERGESQLLHEVT
ncbi:MAG TPA: D-2-hydroxyacid dehydrogenase [Planctomycetaceae bacterium]|nr:D-2-hydroxyacid dehydrogenase [Planctomycetaceae bacterium]